MAALRRIFPGWELKPNGQSRQSGMAYSESEITLVALVLNDWNRTLLSRLTRERRWSIHFAATSTEACQVLNEGKAQIFLFEREVAGADWRGVIRKVTAAPRLVCAILISEVSDDYLWNEVVMWGGHDVLVTPLREEDVLRAIRLAWSFWNSSMKVQPMLMKHNR